MRGLIVCLCTGTNIKNMDMKGPGTQGTWKPTESSAKNHQMKYNINSGIPNAWNDGHLGKLFKNIKRVYLI